MAAGENKSVREDETNPNVPPEQRSQRALRGLTLTAVALGLGALMGGVSVFALVSAFSDRHRSVAVDTVPAAVSPSPGRPTPIPAVEASAAQPCNYQDWLDEKCPQRTAADPQPNDTTTASVPAPAARTMTPAAGPLPPKPAEATAAAPTRSAVPQAAPAAAPQVVQTPAQATEPGKKKKRTARAREPQAPVNGDASADANAAAAQPAARTVVVTRPQAGPAAQVEAEPEERSGFFGFLFGHRPESQGTREVIIQRTETAAPSRTEPTRARSGTREARGRRGQQPVRVEDDASEAQANGERELPRWDREPAGADGSWRRW